VALGVQVPDRTTWMYKNCARTCFERNPCLAQGTCDFSRSIHIEKKKQTHDSLSQFDGDTEEPEKDDEDEYDYGDAEPSDYQLYQSYQQWSSAFNDNSHSQMEGSTWTAANHKKAVGVSGWEAKTPKSERDSLMKIFWSTGGAKWGGNLNWGCGDPCREMWWGVVCTYDKASHSLRVKELLLNQNGLKGVFPDELDLPFLTNLNLKENNSLKGSFPKGLPALTHLISMNSLISIESSILAQSKNLQVIRAGQNLLAGSLEDFVGLQDLEVIDFRGSWEGLVASIPEGFGQLKKLKEIDFSECLLRGDLPESIGELPLLEEFYLSSAELSGSIPKGFLDHPKLRVLDLTKNYMRGELPMSGKGPYPMTVLRLGYNHFNAAPGALEALFASRPKMSEINMANNPLGQPLPDNLDVMPRLEKLIMYGARLFGKIPAIHNLEKLTTVELSTNFIEGPFPADYFSKKPDREGGKRALTIFRMYNCRLTGQLPEDFGAVAQTLIRIDLHSNKIKGAVPTMLSRLPRVREVRLDDNLLSGPMPLTTQYAWLLPYQNKAKDGKSRMHTFRIDKNNFDDKLSKAQQAKYDEKIRRFSADGYIREPKEGKTTFRICDTRIELYGEVLANETMGWVETTGANQWDMAFDACFNKPSKYRHMQHDQKIGEMPKLDIISDKGKFATNMERFRRQFPAEFAFIPFSYIIPAELPGLKTAMDSDAAGLAPTASKMSQYGPDGKAYWLIKPRASCCGRGIRLVNTYDEVPQDKKGQYAGHIAQRFMSNPYHIVGHNPEGPPGGYKFIIRQFVIVSTFEPLSVFVVPDGPMFYTRRPHSLVSKAWKDRASFISDYFFTHTQADLGTTFSRVRKNFIEGVNGHDQIELWRKIKHAVVKTLIPLQERIAQQEVELLPYQRSSYHIFGYDISCNDQQEPVIIEVNAHPMTDLEIVKTNETARKPVVKQDRELKMDMIDRLVSVLGLLDKNPDSAVVKEVTQVVADKMKQFGWEECDEEPGVLIPKKNGKNCMTPQALKDITWSELEMRRKGPLEAAFPLENGNNLMHLFQGKAPRTQVVVDWWEDSKAQKKCGIASEAMERKDAYYAPNIDKTFERDRY